MSGTGTAVVLSNDLTIGVSDLPPNTFGFFLTSTTGSFGLLLYIAQTPTPTGNTQVIAGEAWNFQCWHRDSVGSSVTSNFSDGLSVLHL